jgi:protein involved in polysaccharide export with SLBB domain
MPCRPALTRRMIVLGAAAACLAACGSPYPTNADNPPVAVIPGQLPLLSTYRLQVGDAIALSFLTYTDLNDTAIIGPDGHAALRAVGSVALAGLSIPAATDVLNKLYASKFKHPALSLTVSSYALQQVFVEGEVNAPGAVRSTIPLTAAGAIAQAGGMKLATAHPENTILLRRLADGTVAYYELDFSENLPSNQGDPYLQTNDVIYVPRTNIASVADFVSGNLLRIFPVVITPTFTHNF